MDTSSKRIVWLHGEVKTPPLTSAARVEAGVLLRKVQEGENLTMPWSRPMPSIGNRCYELRINDENRTWRILFRIDEDAILILDVFQKQTQQTPQTVIGACRRRLRQYDNER